MWLDSACSLIALTQRWLQPTLYRYYCALYCWEYLRDRKNMQGLQICKPCMRSIKEASGTLNRNSIYVEYCWDQMRYKIHPAVPWHVTTSGSGERWEGGAKVWCSWLSGVQGRERGSTLKETWVQRGVHACDTIMPIAKGLNKTN